MILKPTPEMLEQTPNSIGQERQFDSQSVVKQASSPISEAITASNIKNIKLKLRNNKLDQLQGMSPKMTANGI